MREGVRVRWIGAESQALLPVFIHLTTPDSWRTWFIGQTEESYGGSPKGAVPAAAAIVPLLFGHEPEE